MEFQNSQCKVNDEGNKLGEIIPIPFNNSVNVTWGNLFTLGGLGFFGQAFFNQVDCPVVENLQAAREREFNSIINSLCPVGGSCQEVIKFDKTISQSNLFIQFKKLLKYK